MSKEFRFVSHLFFFFGGGPCWKCHSPLSSKQEQGAVQVFLPSDNDADAEVDKCANESLPADLGDRPVDLRIAERRDGVLLFVVHRYDLDGRPPPIMAGIPLKLQSERSEHTGTIPILSFGREPRVKNNFVLFFIFWSGVVKPMPPSMWVQK